MEYWTNPEHEKRLFFCQVEAIETVIYLTECARKYGDAWIENFLREANEGSNPGLSRIAFKMATGSGKTVVMALLIAWQSLNKLENPQDAKFTDTFLLISPGITIRDRLRVLLPSDPGNYYRERDIIPPDMMERLAQAKILITNFHAFRQRELMEGARLTKLIAKKDAPPMPLPRHRSRWYAVSAGSLAIRRTSLSSMTRPTIAIAAARKARTKNSPGDEARKPGSGRKKPVSG